MVPHLLDSSGLPSEERGKLIDCACVVDSCAGAIFSDPNDYQDMAAIRVCIIAPHVLQYLSVSSLERQWKMHEDTDHMPDKKYGVAGSGAG